MPDDDVRPMGGFEPPRAGDPPPKPRVLEVQASGVGEWIGGLIVLCIVVTCCLLVLHWAGVL